MSEKSTMDKDTKDKEQHSQGGGDNNGKPGKPGETIKVVTPDPVKNPPRK